METKICKKCNIEKKLEEYNKDKYSKDGYRYRCRECTRVEYKNFYYDNLDREIERQVNYQKNNKEKVKSTRNKRHKTKYEKDYDGILQKINKLEKDNNNMKNDMKKEKFPKGGLVYIVDYTDELEDTYRLGSTDNMNKRKKIYDTHTLHKKPVVYKKEIMCPKILEDCVRALLYNYRYKNRKDFFICKLSKIKLAFKKCFSSINCINQSGGMDDEINVLKNDSIKLLHKIQKLDKNLL